MRITKLLCFSNYIQIKNGKLINAPLPLLGIINKKETEKEKEKEGFPWE